MTSNTACATIAAAGAPRRAKPRHGWPPAGWRGWSFPGVNVRAALVQIGEHKINRDNWDWSEVDTNPFFAPDPEIVPVWEEYLDGIRKAGSSVGAVIEVVAEGVPAGLGAPIYAKLDQDIAANLMSINAVKGVEIGNGFEAARISGEENADEMRMGEDGNPFSCPTMPAAFSAAFPPGSRLSPASPSNPPPPS
jgi:hypothetical protein